MGLTFTRLTFLILVAYSFLLVQTSQAECTGCSVVINNNGNHPNIPNNAVVCITANRTNPIDFNNRNNVQICISEGASWNGSANSLSGLASINNFGTLTVNNDFNGNWTINNFGSLNLSINLNSSKTVNNFSVLNIPRNFNVDGNLFSEGTLNIAGNATFNSNASIAIIGNMNISGKWTNNASTSLAGEIRVSGNLQKIVRVQLKC